MDRHIYKMNEYRQIYILKDRQIDIPIERYINEYIG